MPTTLNWLHLSDLHRGLTAQQWLWTNVESAFFDDLKKLYDRCGPWHLIFFTGDLTQKGDAKEFEKLTETLGRLYLQLRELGSNPILLAIPGNHDLQRPKANAPAVKLLSTWAKDSELQEEFWTDPNSLYRQQIKESFLNFEEWWKTQPFPKPQTLVSGLLPGDFATSIRHDDIDFGVVGLNVTFLQLTKGDYEQKLALSARQISAVCGEHYNDWFKKNDANVLLTHQPPSWLNESSKSALESEVYIPGRFIAHLFGHMHQHKSYTETSGGAKSRNYWQAPSIFGLEVFGENETRQHGYTAGRIEINRPEAISVRLWPRTAVKHQAGPLHIVPDPSSTLDTQESLTIEMQYFGQTAKPTAGARTFSVLLVSTEPDLRETRESVAMHLKKALGVSAVTTSGNEQVNSSTFDHVILVQGWWWDNGKAAQLWQEAEASKRSAFVVAEGSDWPPRRLAELSATDDVSEFIAMVENPHYFDNPKELPEKIGESVTALLQSKTGGERLGLRDWERAYMDFRLPAWKAGRTASPGHLLEAENTEELYEADLYVTLDGTSRKWQRGPDGRPRLVPRKKKKATAEIARETIQPRVPLGRWLSVGQLPRIALVGAPGGGKTVFLTRTAAAVASACLGRPGELEPDIDLDCLRHHSGTLPIPVVLEATRIASRKNLNAAALIDAMSDEMAVATKSIPRSVEIRRGLKNGRYLLLIDALDEVADSAARTSVLDLLKGLAAPAVFPKTRFVLTTRSARYTGSLKFGPELEIVEVAPLSGTQVSQLCSNWTAHRGRDESYLESLMNAVSGLGDQVGSGSPEDQALAENPLMLTAVCMVFERYRSLPDDRGRLCELLIDDLCRSRNSEDLERGWKLDDATKKDLLQRIALAMQEVGAQSWPVSRALQIATTLIPTGDKFTQLRAKKYLDWAADHTGLLRFQQDPKGEEHIRFWHRLFREYLAAARLAQLDKTASDMIDQLWKDKRLESPFWEDVVRLLPRPLGTIEKAKSLRVRLEQLARENPNSNARLLGLAMAGIIENRDLFPDVDFAAKALQLADVYENEGQNWAIKDRLLFLEGLGRLDPEGGDPRFHQPRWFDVPAGKARLESRDLEMPLASAHRNESKVYNVGAFRLSWAPVTVKEFQTFVESVDFDRYYTTEMVRENAKHNRKALRDRIGKQLRHPNWPVVMVAFSEAEAFCRWQTEQRSDGETIRLPLDSEVVLLAHTNAISTGQATERGRPRRFGASNPVGLWESPKAKIVNLWGNLWQWVAYSPDSPRAQLEADTVFGRRISDVLIYTPREFFVDETIGFRVVLGSANVTLSKSVGKLSRRKK